MEKKILNGAFRGLLLLALTGSFFGCGTDKPKPIVKTADEVCQEAVESGELKRIKVACDSVSIESTIGMVANVQLLMKDLAGLISIVASQLNKAPGFAPMAGLDVRSLVESALSDIVARLTKIETLAGKLRGKSWEDLVVKVAKAELSLDIGSLFPDDKDIPSKLKIDLNGEWNRVEIVALGAASSALIGTVEFLLAHKIKLELDSVKDLALTTQFIAGFVAANPDLLSMYDADSFAASAEEFSLALDFVAGKAAAGAGLDGLLAAMDEQIANDADQTDNLLEIKDNGDKKFGKGDSLIVRSVEKAVNALNLQEPPENPGTIKNTGVSRETLVDATELGRAVQANLDGASSTSIALLPYFGNAWKDIKAYVEVPNAPDPKDWIAFNPKKFFDAKKPIRAYIPAIYAVNISGPDNNGLYTRFDGTKLQSVNPQDGTITVTDITIDTGEVTWDFLFECELAYSAATWAITTATNAITDASGWRIFCGYSKDDPAAEKNPSLIAKLSSKHVAFGVGTTAPDAGHFYGQVIGLPADVMTAVTNTTGTFVWMAGVTPVAPIATDGVTPGVPNSDADGLPYIGLQDASFGGALYLDPTGAGSFASDTDNFTFNKTLATIFNNYIETVVKALE